MGKISLVAKITHVPSMLLSEQPGPHFGCRQAAIDGHYEIGRRCREAGVDTIIVFDTHWLVNTAYHINAIDRYKGVYTSNEFPHFIQDLEYDFKGAPELGDEIARIAKDDGVRIMSHHVKTLDLEYGTLVPMRYINPDAKMSILSIAAWCPWHEMEDSAKVGAAVRKAVEASDRNVAILASGSLSHRIHDNNDAPAGIHTISDEFYKQVDLRVLDLWRNGQNEEFVKMLPLYSKLCHGEGFMHDTAMLFGVLGWDTYKGKGEVLTEYFPSSGTGQCNVVFPLAA